MSAPKSLLLFVLIYKHFFSLLLCHFSHRSLPEALSTSPNLMREDIKRLKLIELQLKDEVKGLAHQRDGLVMELQQLQEAKPVLEKAYAVRLSAKITFLLPNVMYTIQIWSKLNFGFISFIADASSKSYSKDTTARTEESSIAILFETTATLHRVNYAS